MFKTHSAINTDTFALPNADTFAGTSNYVKGMTFGNYPFLKSLLYSIVITVLSVTLILLCTSMAAWFISRVGGRFSRLFYLGCVFSMIVPFQMVMFPLVSVANDLYLNTPWTIPVIYLGFGAGLAVFMFSGFVKSLPLEIEEAAAIDGAGPARQFFSITLPMITPTILFNLITSIISSFQQVTLVMLLTNGGPMKSTYFYGLMTYNNAFKFHKLGYASANAWVMFIIILLLSALVFKSSDTWVFYESTANKNKAKKGKKAKGKEVAR